MATINRRTSVIVHFDNNKQHFLKPRPHYQTLRQSQTLKSINKNTVKFDGRPHCSFE